MFESRYAVFHCRSFVKSVSRCKDIYFLINFRNFYVGPRGRLFFTLLKAQIWLIKPDLSFNVTVYRWAFLVHMGTNPVYYK